MEEIEARFGRESELRRTQMESLNWMADLARKAGVPRIVINGSFTTDRLEPNDVDCVLLTGPDFPQDAAATAELFAGIPFINFEFASPSVFREYIERIFASDRDLIQKGMLEILP